MAHARTLAVSLAPRPAARLAPLRAARRYSGGAAYFFALLPPPKMRCAIAAALFIDAIAAATAPHIIHIMVDGTFALPLHVS